MKLVRPSVLALMRFNIQVRALHIEGKLNDIADSISFSNGSFQVASPQRRPCPIRYSCGVHDNHFQSDIDHLLKNSVSSSTARQYELSLNHFNDFRKQFGLKNIWPAPVQDIMSFIANMYRKCLSFSTVNCYISGLSFYNKINNFEDYTQMFIVRKMIEGIKRSKLHEKDHRLPIIRELLNRILSILSIICTSHYEADLFKAAFLLAFHGFFRVRELTVGPKGDQIHTVKIENVKLFSNQLFFF